MRGRFYRLIVAVGLAVGLIPGFAAAGPVAADAAEQGPALTVPVERLEAALSCVGDLADTSRDPILLTPAFSSDQTSYGWNYLPRLAALGIPHCSISVEDEGYADLQTTAEYVVYAVRRMRAISGRKVVLFGHQHGALDELWGLTFWPDVAGSVSDLISLATPYRGTTASGGLCESVGCAEATWQISTGSDFVTALDSAPLPRGPSYTSIASLNDTLITPQPGASVLEGASNIQLQDICPGRMVSHFEILADAVAYQLFLDAINHRGPARPGRIPASACDERLMPGADPIVLAAADAFLAVFLARNVELGVAAEPATRSYAIRRAPTLAILSRTARLDRRGRIAVRLRCESVGSTACRAKLALRRHRKPAGHERLVIDVGEAVVARVRIKPRLREALRDGARVRLASTLHATDALGNRGTVTKRLEVSG